MRKARVLFLLLLLVAGLSAGLYGMRSGWFDRERGFEGADGLGAPPAPKQDAAATTRPTFDIVRAEPDGSVIMAGRSEPGWSITVQSGGKVIASGVADENGEWVAQPTDLLPKGEYSLELSAKAPKGDRTLFSTQRLALSLSDPKIDQPLVALTEEGKSTRVLQMPPPAGDAAPAKTKSAGFDTATANALPLPEPDSAPPSPIGFASVDYEDAGEKSMLHMNGPATPGTRVMLYVDNEFVGAATADATGNWSFSGNRQLTGGNHTLRADLIAKDASKVTARAEVRFDRTEGDAQFVAEDNAKLAALNDTVPVGAAPAEAPPAAGGAIIVRRGDTLWQIAQRHYGDGAKYTQIFRNNRKQIRNPNLIYPAQRFELPQ